MDGKGQERGAWQGGELMSVEQVSQVLFGPAAGTGEMARVRRLIRKGPLGAVKLGPAGKSKWWVPRGQLETYLVTLRREAAELSDTHPMESD
jgi:hypothetical protein